jgi:hypothetical protein
MPTEQIRELLAGRTENDLRIIQDVPFKLRHRAKVRRYAGERWHGGTKVG